MLQILCVSLLFALAASAPSDSNMLMDSDVTEVLMDSDVAEENFGDDETTGSLCT